MKYFHWTEHKVVIKRLFMHWYCFETLEVRDKRNNIATCNFSAWCVHKVLEIIRQIAKESNDLPI